MEELGFKHYWNLFSGPPLFARKVFQALTDHCEVPSNFALDSSKRSSNRTAPSSSRGIDELCRSCQIMAFDTARQSSRNLSGLMYVHFLSRIGIEIGDSVTAGLCFQESTLSHGMLLHFEVTCTLNRDSSFDQVLLLHPV